MRVTLSQQIQTSLMHTNLTLSKLADTQAQTSSGKRILKVSDDVSGTISSLSLRSAINTTAQLANNITVSKPLVNTALSAIDDLMKDVKNVSTLANQAANTIALDDPSALLAELDSILSKMVSTANTKYNGSYIFSGTAASIPPIVQEAGSASYIYQGNDDSRSIQILPSVSVAINIPGSSVFNINSSGTSNSTDLFTMVSTLKDAIKTGDTEQVSAQLENIDANLRNLLQCCAKLGSLTNRMDSATDTLTGTSDRLAEVLSNTEDVDITKAVMDLQSQQLAYELALSASSKMLKLSLASLEYF